MNQDVIITCAVTGAGDVAEKHPGLPVTPREIAEAAIEAARAGAAIAHIHVRDIATRRGSREFSLYREVVQRIRDHGTDVIINLTTGMGGDIVLSPKYPFVDGPGTDLVGPEERISHLAELRPEMCSLDCGTMNFGEGVFLNAPDHLRTMARGIQALDIKPELEVFDLGHVRLAAQLMAEGLISAPPLFLLCLGIPWGAPATTDGMQAMRGLLPPNAVWSAFGISRAQMPMAAQAVLLGGNVRVGLEDNLYLSKGVTATNRQLVEKAVRIVEDLGASVCPPRTARERLGLTKRGAA
jgi:uncharacterized protein (DUF849 family)